VPRGLELPPEDEERRVQPQRFVNRSRERQRRPRIDTPRISAAQVIRSLSLSQGSTVHVERDAEHSKNDQSSRHIAIHRPAAAVALRASTFALRATAD
jgi:hypothetical protein